MYQKQAGVWMQQMSQNISIIMSAAFDEPHLSDIRQISQNNRNVKNVDVGTLVDLFSWDNSLFKANQKLSSTTTLNETIQHQNILK